MSAAPAGIYVPMGSEGFELCHPVVDEGFEKINVEVSGMPVGENWKPIPVHLIKKEHGRPLHASDSPWLGSQAMIFRKNSVLPALGTMLAEFGEILPLACQDENLMIYNPTRKIDALDEKASTIVRFADGNAMWITKYVFSIEKIKNVDIFKIPSLRVSPTFLSHRFVDLWNESGLRGLEFNQVWAS